MSQPVILKSNRYGINLILDNNISFAELKKAVLDKFKESEKFFKNASIAISFEGRILSGEEELELLDLIAESRTDELEDEFQEKRQKYRDAIQEVTQCENAIHELGLSKEAKKTIDRYVSAVGHRWILCGDYLYKSGMRDILRLLENR